MSIMLYNWRDDNEPRYRNRRLTIRTEISFDSGKGNIDVLDPIGQSVHDELKNPQVVNIA